MTLLEPKKLKEEKLPLVSRDVSKCIEDVEKPLSVVEELMAIFTLLGPVVFTLVNEYLPAVTNIVLVGHVSSPETKEHVDATAIASMFLNITSMSVGLGLASSLDTLCTQAYGAGNTKKFGEYLQGAILGTALFLTPVILINWFSASILIFLQQDPEISVMAGVFIQYSTVGIPFLCAYELIKRLLQAYQITLPSAIIAVVSNVIHIGVGYYLTNYSSYGFYGAAIGRSIAYVALPFLLLPYFLWNPVHKEWNMRWKFSEAIANLPSFLEFGVPGMIALVVEWAAFEILTLMSGLMTDHTVTLGVNSILMTIISLVYMLFWGVSTAACIRIGYYLGANKPTQAKLVTKLCYGVTLGCCLCTATILIATRKILPKVFVDDREIIERTSYAVLFLIPCHMIDSMNCVTTGVLRAMGKQQVGVVILTSAYYIVGVPAAAICAFYFGWSVEGLWVGFTCGTAIACATYGITLSSTNWAQLAAEASIRGAD